MNKLGWILILKTKFVLIFLILFINITEAQTLHAIIFASTDDPEITISEGITNSVVEFKKELSYVEKFTSLILKPYYYTGTEYNRQSIDYVLDHLVCESGDVIFFYYIGHGFNNSSQVSDYPFFPMIYPPYDNERLGNNSIGFESIMNKLKSKGARLTIGLADACNDEIDVALPQIAEFKGLAALSIDTRNKERYRELYLNSSGSIIATSCQKGQKAHISNSGGLFTSSFIEVLKESTAISNIADWQTIFDKTSKRTQTLCDINNNVSQNIVVNINIKATSNNTVSWDGFLVDKSNYFHSQPDNFLPDIPYPQPKFVIAKIVFFSGSTYFLMSDNYIIKVDYFGNAMITGYRSYPTNPSRFVWDIVNPVTSYNINRWGVDYYGNIWWFNNYGWLKMGIVYY